MAPTQPTRVFDRHFWFAIVVAAVVVIPRTALVSRAHCEYWDDHYHLRHGITFLMHVKPGDMRQDAPLGQAVMSLPLLVTGSFPHPDSTPGAEPSPHKAVLYDQRVSRETLSLLVALWKAVLLLPMAGLVFHWCRRLYGVRGGWLGLALLLVEPTVAGHVAPASLDVLGTGAGLFACFFAWRYFEAPTTRRVVAAGAAVAAAMLTKHTAIITPGVVALFAVVHWLHDRRGVAGESATGRRRFNQLLSVGVVAFVALWPLSLFDVSRPNDHGPPVNAEYTESFSFRADVINGSLMRHWPAGAYIGSIRGGQMRAEGHPSYLWGRHSWTGWWYYYPAVALYKVPLGIALVLAAAALSVPLRVRPRFNELPLAFAFLSWAAFLSASNVHIGWRHFLPAYLPLLMLAARVAAVELRPLRWVVWLGVAVAGVHGLLWHPDYLSYVNFPHDKPWLAISDSNVDWGQSLKQVRMWLDANPQGDRPVWLGYFGPPEGHAVSYYLGDRVRPLKEEDPPPERGLLIISPVWVAGAYGGQKYVFLRDRRPDAVIGHTMLVYDLDRLAK